jgi:hypothetical protein
MSDRTTFTPEEWTILCEAPALVAMAVTIAGSSGLFGTIAEAFGTTSAMVEGMKSESALIRAVCTREDLMVAQQGLKEKLKDLKAGDLVTAQNRVRMMSLAVLRQAMEIVAAKGTADDVRAYRGFIHGLGTRVAHAAKEGSFLGLGGERVSEGERTMLMAIEHALGTTPA